MTMKHLTNNLTKKIMLYLQTLVKIQNMKFGELKLQRKKCFNVANFEIDALSLSTF